MTNDALTGELAETLTEVTPNLGQMPVAAVDQFGKIAAKEIDGFGKTIKEITNKALDFATVALETAINKGIDQLPFGGIINGMLKQVTTGLCSTIKEAGKELLGTVLEGAKEIAGKVVENVSHFAKKTLGAICSWLSGDKSKDQVVADTKKAFTDAKDNVQHDVINIAHNTANQLQGNVNKTAEKVTHQLHDGFNKVVEAATKEVVGKFSQKVVEQSQSPSQGKDRI